MRRMGAAAAMRSPCSDSSGAIIREGDHWVATDKVAGIEIPDTLHGLLLARIDRLPADSRRTLRVASVIGRQFAVTILERLLESKTQ